MDPNQVQHPMLYPPGTSHSQLRGDAITTEKVASKHVLKGHFFFPKPAMDWSGHHINGTIWHLFVAEQHHGQFESQEPTLSRLDKPFFLLTSLLPPVAQIYIHLYTIRR